MTAQPHRQTSIAARKCPSIFPPPSPPPPGKKRSTSQMEDSFPASDPPSFSGGNHIIGAPVARESEAATGERRK